MSDPHDSAYAANEERITEAQTSFQGVPEAFESALDKAEFRRPLHLDGVELYRAHIVRHAFDAHTHQAFGIGAIEAGVERFRYAGSDYLAPPDSIVLMNPDVLHTGRAETEHGWRYRMVYIEPALAEQITGESGWWFDEAVCSHAPHARQVTLLLDAMWHAPDSLAFDSALFSLLALGRVHARGTPTPVEARQRFEPVLDYMRSMMAERLTLTDLAAVAGLSPFHFLRSFQKQYHVTPQQMLMAIRLYEAKQMLTAGIAPAQVAVTTGMCDQAHLTRAFVRRYGVPPARYQQQTHHRSASR